MSGTGTPDIHRYLDEAFAGIAMTAEAQDLKEEIRANLAARALELQSKGMDASGAAAKAVAELGDIHELLGSLGSEAGPARAIDDLEIHRVRPRPAFVVRTVILSLGLVASSTLVVLGALRAVDWAGEALANVAAAGGALALGLIVADTLRQETSRHYPLPRARSVSYGVAAAVALLGVCWLGLFAAAPDRVVLLVLGALGSLAALVGFVWLGVTQTNRTKPWARELGRRQTPEDRFSSDPAAAARFGIYSAAIVMLTLAAFVIVGLTAGFAWSWPTLLVGIAVLMITLARMLFPAQKEGARHQPEE